MHKNVSGKEKQDFYGLEFPNFLKNARQYLTTMQG
jgi:hypothetical protein